MKATLYDILAGHSTLVALVGSRIYPQNAPDNAAVPYVIYQQISGQRDIAMDGATGRVESSWQISCWANTPASAATICQAAYGALKDKNTAVIQYVNLINEMDLYSDVPSTNVLRKYGKAMTIDIHYVE